MYNLYQHLSTGIYLPVTGSTKTAGGTHVTGNLWTSSHFRIEASVLSRSNDDIQSFVSVQIKRDFYLHNLLTEYSDGSASTTCSLLMGISSVTIQYSSGGMIRTYGSLEDGTGIISTSMGTW